MCPDTLTRPPHAFRNMSGSDEDADSQQASTHLERADQSSECQRHAASDMSKALVQKHMIGSKDKVASNTAGPRKACRT
jgi:hypothetical protein